MNLLSGKDLSKIIQKEIKQEVDEMLASGQKRPHLAAVLVGNDGASETYVGHKVKMCKAVGFESTLVRLSAEISEADFGSVRGVQALVKDAVKASVAKINQAEFGWPFNAAEHTATLVVGQAEYDWPQYFKIADWNSFQIQADDNLGAGFKTLKFSNFIEI